MPSLAVLRQKEKFLFHCHLQEIRFSNALASSFSVGRVGTALQGGKRDKEKRRKLVDYLADKKFVVCQFAWTVRVPRSRGKIAGRREN
jgi:hypothetical protein